MEFQLNVDSLQEKLIENIKPKVISLENYYVETNDIYSFITTDNSEPRSRSSSIASNSKGSIVSPPRVVSSTPSSSISANFTVEVFVKPAKLPNFSGIRNIIGNGEFCIAFSSDYKYGFWISSGNEPECVFCWSSKTFSDDKC